MNLSRSIKHLLAVMLMFTGFSFAQTVHQISAGTDVLLPAIEAAAEGDIIELVSDGGVYLSADQIEINKNLTIRAAQGLNEKPVLKYTGDATSAYLFKLTASPKVSFEGLELDGDGTGDGAAAMAKYGLRLDNGDAAGTMEVRVTDCVLHDFNEKIIKPYASCGIDSLIVKNTVFYNGTKEGVVLYTGSTSDPAVELDYAEFYNCTFYGFEREAIKADTNPNTVMRVNHCTFYNNGGTSKPMLYVDDLLDVEVKNSLFVTNGNTDNFARLESSDNQFHHVVFYDVASHDIADATVSDTLYGDPDFADATNGDFTLGSFSAASGYADDGLAAGALMWDPAAQLPQVIEVLEGTDMLTAAINSAAEGDTVELVSSGGIYLSTEQFQIDKDIVIRAKAGLAEKPVLKYIGDASSPYMFKLVASPKVTFEGIEFYGDGTPDGAAAVSKYALRLDNEDAEGTMEVRVFDCEFNHFDDKFIKPYPSCGIDSLIVRNSVFHDGAREGITLYSGSSSDPAVELEYAEFYNCTFYNIEREAIKGDTNPNIVFRMNQCTVYNCGGSGKSFVFVDDLLDVEVKNSIFVENQYSTYFARFESTDNIFKNNVFYDVASHEVVDATVSDTLFADPVFADAAAGDFTLGAESQARTAGEGGTPAGDLRWAIDPNAVILTVLTEGMGIVTLDPPGNIYSPGTSVTLTATADNGWLFSGWEGVSVFPPDNPVATVTINENMTVKAIFVSAQPQVTLNYEAIGLGEVTVEPAPASTGSYDQGTEVTLTATPVENWHFVTWEGDVVSETNPITFTVDSNMTVNGRFASNFTQYTLNLDVEGMGSVVAAPEPILGTYDSNTVVTLNATAAQGWEFAGFTGDLTGTSVLDSVLMNSDKNITATFTEIEFGSGVLEIDTTWDLFDAVMFANNNSMIDTLVLAEEGVYTSYNAEDVSVLKPLTIMAKPGLETKPVITNSDVEEANIDIFRVYDDFTLVGVVIDGGNELSHGMKYAVRLSNSSGGDTVRFGADQTFIDVDFMNMFEKKDSTKDGHVFKIDTQVRAGGVVFENCTVNGTGYEAIRISDTEKWDTDRALDSLIIRNCTFTNCDAEAVRYYSDALDDTPDAPIVIEHVTFDNTATRVMFLKNSGGAIIRDIIISNSRMSNHGRDEDILDAQGTSVFPSYVSNVDTFNVLNVPIKSTDGVVDTATIYGIDPEYADASANDYTLAGTSHLYRLASDGEALGDLRWATNDPVNFMITVMVEGGNGSVVSDPMPIGNTYAPGTVVTLTAVPDSGYTFIKWEGDASGEETSATVTVDADKEVTAVFDILNSVEDEMIPVDFSMDQNYPNPFNPTTMINFGLPVTAKVTLKVYDVLGREVAVLRNSTEMNAGYHKVMWNGLNDNGVRVSSGIYIYRISASGIEGRDFVNTKKMIMLK